MDADSLENWSSGGLLPDTDNIRLGLSDGFLTVMGKKLEFDTWWFTWPELSDFFLEMTVRVGTCSGLDSYGVIFRGPPRGVTPAHGYIAIFSCDGRFQLRRVDTTNPYTFVDLIGWTPSTAIRSGSNQTNVLGIRAVGSTFTLYANGFRLTEVSDTRFAEGRYGVFVRSGETAVFTYSVDQIVHWVLETSFDCPWATGNRASARPLRTIPICSRPALGAGSSRPDEHLLHSSDACAVVRMAEAFADGIVRMGTWRSRPYGPACSSSSPQHFFHFTQSSPVGVN
jgi:hypothetical protein